MRSPRPLTALVFSAGVLVAVATGCGSDDDTAASTTSTEAAPTTTAADTTTTADDTTTTTTEPSGSTTTTDDVTTTTEVAAGPTLEEIKGASIPALCLHPPTTLVDGEDTTLAPNQGVFELLDALPSGEPAYVEGVPSDAGALTVIVARCNAGGVSWPNAVLFFSSGGTYYGGTFLQAPTAEDEAPATGSWEGAWDRVGGTGPGRDNVSTLALDGDAVVLTTTVGLADDGACCPSGEATVRLRPAGGLIEVDDITRTDPGA